MFSRLQYTISKVFLNATNYSNCVFEIYPQFFEMGDFNLGAVFKVDCVVKVCAFCDQKLSNP